jgi:hypothetical protein
VSLDEDLLVLAGKLLDSSHVSISFEFLETGLYAIDAVGLSSQRPQSYSKHLSPPFLILGSTALLALRVPEAWAPFYLESSAAT